jgi:hypothetical protein
LAKPSGAQAQLEFRLAGAATSPLVRMRIVRDRQIEPPAYRFDIDSQSQYVPQSVAALIQSLKPAEENRLANLPPSPNRTGPQ